jgi:ureidoacrylate peracid hydrolase
MHDSRLHPDVIALLLQRRGKLHVFDAIEPRRTALVVIDMQVAFLGEGAPSEVPMARAIVPTINRVARALRGAGGTVVWVLNTFTEAVFEDWSCFLGGTYNAALSRRIVDNLKEGAAGHKLWPALEPAPGDLWIKKNRFSAFLPGASDIEAELRRRGIDTVAIAGTLTNVCCESSARDAMMRNFNVIFLADANATYNDTIHNASLNSMAVTFCDVMTCDEALERLPGRSPSRSAAE